MFRLRALRELTADNRRLVRGAAFEADAAVAAELLRSGAAVLVDEADLRRLLRVVQPATAGVPATLVTRSR